MGLFGPPKIITTIEKLKIVGYKIKKILRYKLTIITSFLAF